MYCNHYGFSEKPFDVTPDPRFLYLTSDHRETLASIIYGIQERRGFITIVGEVGTGKTTLLNAAIDRLDIKTKIAFIFNTDMPFTQILNMALYELGLKKSQGSLSKVNAIQRLNDFAIQQLAKGGNIVLILDEAHILSRSAMENLRLLSNLETRRHKLVQIVLSGQPELDTNLDQHELRQLAQRINLRRYIYPLNKQDTLAYLQHRLTFVTKSDSSLFSSQAKQMIWEYSGGIPRKVNVLCDNTLLIGFGLKKKKINAAIVQEAAEDLKWERLSKPKPPLKNSPVEAVIPYVETKPPRRRFAVATTMFLVGGLMILGSFFLGRTGFQFIRIANTKNVPIESAKTKTHIKNEGKTDLTAPVKVEEKMRQVVVKQGDSLASIIQQTYGVYNDVILNKVLQENPEVISPRFILPGQVIKLPVGKEHITIREGKSANGKNPRSS